MTNLSVFQLLCNKVNQHEPLHIPSPPSQKRRAAVVAILRWRRHRTDIPITHNKISTLAEFFNQDWVKQDTEGEAEILFMQRATRVGDRWSGHVSFVGGKNEPGETDQETAQREVMEEIGIDLKSDDYIEVGKLNEREISSIKDNRLLMILIPFVYLQVAPESPSFTLQESEVAAVQWVPLSFFLGTPPYPSRPMTEPLTFGIRNPWIQPFIRFFMGSVSFPAIDLPTSPETNKRLCLWGLTMGMTRDLIEFTQLDQLAFVNLVKKKPSYSRPDIGWLTSFITQLTIYKRCLRKNRATPSEWDKIYIGSIRKAVMVAVLLRLGFTGVIFTLLFKRLKK